MNRLEKQVVMKSWFSPNAVSLLQGLLERDVRLNFYSNTFSTRIESSRAEWPSPKFYIISSLIVLTPLIIASSKAETKTWGKGCARNQAA